MKRSGLIILAIVAVLVIWGISTQRGLVNKDEGVKNAWNKVQSEYQQRSDLVGQLVETVKGVANFEKTTLTDVINARSKATSVNISADNLTPEKVAEFQKAQVEIHWTEWLKDAVEGRGVIVIADEEIEVEIEVENFLKLK